MDFAIKHNAQAIFNIQSSNDFLRLSKDIFQYQYKHNKVYRQYVDLLNLYDESIDHYTQFPFLPISFFKSHKVTSFDQKPDQIFLSSQTTSGTPSQHFVKDLNLYEQSFQTCFSLFFGDPKAYAFVFLLPSYLERKGSSLIYMANALGQSSKHSDLTLFSKKIDQTLIDHLRYLKAHNIKTVLLGVSYALLDLAEALEFDLESFIVIETGGMKGTRQDMSKEALHQTLKQGLGLKSVYSEYGMTELLSQAYLTKSDLRFRLPAWMKVSVRDVNDPLNVLKTGRGALNIIDLANVYSCSFIATEDVGEVFEDGSFTVLGRMKDADIRGCNLMYEK